MTLLEEALSLLRRVYDEDHSGTYDDVPSLELSDDIADFLELPRHRPVPGSIAEQLEKNA